MKVWMKNKDYHEDESQRVEGERHAGIVVKGHQVLMIHRIKNGEEYYVFPGGHRRIDEKGEDVVLREIEEETAIIAANSKIAFKHYDTEKQQADFYYLCDWISGEEPHLNGEEAIRNCEENFYKPMWVDLSRVKDLNILPRFAKDRLLLYL